MQELWFLRFAFRLMLTDNHIKFREDILNGFQVIERTHFFMMDKVPREIIQKVWTQELWFLCSACHLMLTDIYMKFLEGIFNRFQVIEGHDFVTDKVPREITQTV